MLRDVSRQLLANMQKPLLCNDDTALRNSQLHLIAKMLRQPHFLPLLTPAQPTNLFMQIAMHRTLEAAFIRTPFNLQHARAAIWAKSKS